MALRHIFCDKTELVLMVETKKKVQPLNVTYDQIIRIQFEPCKEFRFFRFVPSEKIQIMTRKREQPVEYTMYKEKQYFGEYKKELEKFARENKITFINNLGQS